LEATRVKLLVLVVVVAGGGGRGGGQVCWLASEAAWLHGSAVHSFGRGEAGSCIMKRAKERQAQAAA